MKCLSLLGFIFTIAFEVRSQHNTIKIRMPKDCTIYEVHIKNCPSGAYTDTLFLSPEEFSFMFETKEMIFCGVVIPRSVSPQDYLNRTKFNVAPIGLD